MMKKKHLNPVVLMFVILAILGFINTLLTNPGLLVRNVLLLASFAGIVFTVVYFFIIRKRPNQDELKKYRRAVKKSNKRQHDRKYQQPNKNHFKNGPSIATKRTTHAPHLRVIDGKKPTKKGPMSL